jgi:hypothetical protein
VEACQRGEQVLFYKLALVVIRECGSAIAHHSASCSMQGMTLGEIQKVMRKANADTVPRHY